MKNITITDVALIICRLCEGLNPTKKFDIINTISQTVIGINTYNPNLIWINAKNNINIIDICLNLKFCFS
jgi:hypothetical protein